MKPITSCLRHLDRLLLVCFAAAMLLTTLAMPVTAGAGNPVKTIRVVADDNYPAYLFRDENDRAQGYLVDYWKLWEYKTGVHVDFKPMKWSLAQDAIQAGQADVIDTIFVTTPRLNIYDFTAPYVDLPVNIYTNKEINGITDTDTLQGFLVGVMDGDACIDVLAEAGITYLKKYANYKDLILAADRGDVKVFCLDEAPANYYFYKLNAGADIRKAFELYVGQFHRAVRKGDTATLALVQRGMDMISPAENAALREKWFGKPTDIWYLGRLAVIILVVMSAVGGLLFLWNVALRQLVSMRTADLQNTLIDLRDAQRVADEYQRTLEKRVAERTQELSRSTESLRLSNDELHAIFDAATVGISLIHRGAVESCNTTMETMFGYGEGELNGKAVRALYPDEESYAQDIDQLHRDLVAHGDFRKESEIVRKDGSRFWCRMMVQPIAMLSLDEGYAATFEDISLEQEAMAEIEKARKLAEDAAAVKARFLANMSHEIRTPMNAIMGMTHLALHADPPARVQDYLRKIDRSSKHLLAIISDILDFSKVEAGKMVIESTAFDLRALINDVADLNSEGISGKGLELVVDIPRDVPATLIGDPLRISQILINYVNNAVKFTESGQVVIAVRAEGTQGSRPMLRVSVRDTGVGLTEEQQKQLFQTFHQVDTSTTRKFGGTGLGLAISRRLAELMGGEVGVESAPGAGSTFWFTVPLEEATAGTTPVAEQEKPMSGRGLVADDDQAALTAAPGPRPGSPARAPEGSAQTAAGRSTSSVDIRGARVLLVEDNALNQEVACEILKEFGLLVDLAENGAVAIEKLAAHHYDVILMDLQMPVMDGIQATLTIRQDPRYKNLPIIAMTASVLDEDRKKCLDAGMSDHVAKPMEPDRLLEVLKRWLGPRLADGPRPVDGSPPDAPSAPPRHREAGLPRALLDVAGLQPAQGLRRVNGKTDLYLSLLGMFVTGQRGVPDQIARALETGDGETALRLAHTLKGVSGNIGAPEVTAAAEILETALKEGKREAVIDQALPDLRASLEGLIAGLVPALQSNIPAAESPVSPEKIEEVTSRLKNLLVEDDAEATEVLAGNADLLGKAFPAEFPMIAYSIRNFDYEAALAFLEQACSRRTG